MLSHFFLLSHLIALLSRPYPYLSTPFTLSITLLPIILIFNPFNLFLPSFFPSHYSYPSSPIYQRSLPFQSLFFLDIFYLHTQALFYLLSTHPLTLSAYLLPTFSSSTSSFCIPFSFHGCLPLFSASTPFFITTCILFCFINSFTRFILFC